MLLVARSVVPVCPAHARAPRGPQTGRVEADSPAGPGTRAHRTAVRGPAVRLPGAPEADLPPDLVPGPVPAGAGHPLAADLPAPPWDTRVQAALWCHRAPAAARAVPPGGPAPLLVVGAVVRYLESPVGPYEEVLGALVPASLRARVPFLAVDVVVSLLGGRAHWALPKTLAAFDRGAGGVGGVVASGDGWSLRASSREAGPGLPVAGLAVVRQPRPGAAALRFQASARGRCRLARVRVDVASDRAGEPGSIAGWLLPGEHPGLVLRARLRVGGPRR